MMDSKCRAQIQGQFDRLVCLSGLVKIHPNLISVFAFLLGLSAAVLLGMGQVWGALVCLWLSGLLDVFDGTVARLANKSSKLGAFLDLIFDRLVEAFVILGFFFFQPQAVLHYLLFFVVVLFNFSTFVVAGALFKNEGKKSMHYDIGVVERTETFVFFSLMMLFPSYLQLVLGICNALICLTALLRMYRIIQHERGAPS